VGVDGEGRGAHRDKDEFHGDSCIVGGYTEGTPQGAMLFRHCPGSACDLAHSGCARRRRDPTGWVASNRREAHLDEMRVEGPMSTTEPRPPQRPRPKHLMDPANPQRPVASRPGMSLTTVQMWVMSVLAVSTLLHMSLAVLLGAFYVDSDRLDAQIGLLVIAGLFGVFAVAAGAAIHRKRILSWWLLLGWIPAVAGAFYLF
jgi:hypothetical protein